MQRGKGAESGGAGIREGRMAESGAELEGRWAGGGEEKYFSRGGETIDIGGGLLYYTDGLGCFPGCFCYENAVRLNNAGLFLL